MFAVSRDWLRARTTGIVKEGDRPARRERGAPGRHKNKLKSGRVPRHHHTELVQDPDNKTPGARSRHGSTPRANYASSIAAMETNSATLNMIMFRPE